MTQQTHLATATDAPVCDPATATTRSLLGYGVLAGPFYVVVSLTEALTRDGFDPSRHSWSLLSNGDLGWIHVATFVLTGLMTIAFAAGLRRALRPGRGAVWAPRLAGAYGASLLAAGAFRADPAMGFPAGTPEGPGQVSWHGLLHLASGGVGFACLVAACLVIAARFSREGRRGWAAFSRVTGVAVLAAFAGIASGAGSPATVLSFTAAVVLAWAWVAALAVHLYRRAGA
ncbi:hypothetical protein GCM10009530_23710 [Microbispora corallina]|uniref:DUF998 domain-containing protein n=1 Tax=Microbispora corallina TaxID=83302 RepID=A0ABQ4G7F8_9ACTN|nr:DUF998 domain-containing protein [Microbispora corallina]GIH43020.1 hypothetical protein Mco01_60200 [Microbispora corallina]